MLTVTTADAAALEYAQFDPATVTLRYGFTDVGTLTGAPAASLASLPVTAAVPAAPPIGSTTFLADATGAGVLVTVAGAVPGPTRSRWPRGTPPSVITTPLVVPIQLLTSLLPISRGTTVTGEVLGSGNAALASQAFTLANSPLTYLAGGQRAGEHAGGVRGRGAVAGGGAFYGQTPDARVFTVSRSPDQTVTSVAFGDGTNGARRRRGPGT